MTPINWPASLPCFRWEPYSVAPRPGSLEANIGMLTSLARIYTLNNEAVSVELILNSTQEQTFRTFYKTTLSMGTQWFNGDIQRNGTLEPAELLFIGAPPVFVPVGHNVVRATFNLLTRGEPLPEPVYELTATYAVNIDALDTKPSNDLTTPGGTIVPITTLSTDKVIVRKPSIADDPELTWDAWSQWGSDGATPPGDGITWLWRVRISDEDDELIAFPGGDPDNPSVAPEFRRATIPLALAASAAYYPLELTGHTLYQFWDGGFPASDNRGGISVRVDVYSRVS